MQRRWAVVGCAVGVFTSVCPGWTAAAAAPEPETLSYALVLTGTELLEGTYADVHAPFITSTLHPLGARCVAVLMVRDRREDLLRTLEFARTRAPLVLVTGGLGPTDADLTRQVLAEFTGIPLREDAELLARLERRFGRPAQELSPGVRRQAQVPASGSYLPNPQGTAAGLVFEAPDSVLVALPGPPAELRPMVTQSLVPYLTRRFQLRPPGSSIRLRFVGIGESAITDALHRHLALPEDVSVAFQFEAGRVDLTLALAGNTAEDQARLDGFRATLVERLGEYVYAQDGTSLEQRVLQLLAARGLTLAAAEVGTGGAVTQALLDQAEGAGLIKGALVAGDHPQLAAMLALPVADPLVGLAPDKPESAEQAAERVRKILAAQWGLAVLGTVEESGASRFLWVAAGSGESRFHSRRITARGGIDGRARMVTEILDFLRRALQEPVAGG